MVQGSLIKSRDTPTMPLMKKVRDLMDESMPNIYEITEAAIRTMIEEELDYPVLYFGIPGNGKSNFSLMLNTLKAYILEKEHGLKKRFSLKNAAWLGEQYIGILEKPSLELIELKSMKDIRELQERWMGTVFWMDEAQDLNVLEFSNTFNRSMNKILATIRALQLIYGICIDFPTKLLPDIRQGRIKTAYYTVIHNEKYKVNGRMRNKRAAFMYGRNEWVKVATAPSKNVRTALLIPTRFINAFPPAVTEFIPAFPESKFLDKYKLLKFKNMGRNTLNEINKIKLKREEKEYKRKPVLKNLPNLKTV